LDSNRIDDVGMKAVCLGLLNIKSLVSLV